MAKHKAQNIAIGCGAALGILMIVIFILDAIKITPYETYRDEQYGFQLKHPAYWSVYHDEKIPRFIVGFVTPKSSKFDLFQENLTITYEKIVKPGLTFRGFSKMAVDQMTGTFGKYMQVLEDKHMTLDGHPAHKFVHVGQVPGYKNQLKYVHIWVGRGKTVFVITFIGQTDEFEKNYKHAQKMIRSFEFIE
ncbi:MAG: hypothetical protein ACLFPX_03990 [Candidatus Omnitrophota bacterium]